MFLTVLGIVFPVFFVVFAGWAYARRYDANLDIANRINIDVFVPALVFSVLANEHFELARYAYLAIAALTVLLGSGVFAILINKFLGYQWRTFVPPMMFSNTGNLGMPLAVFAFGPAALPVAVVLFLVENLAHFSIGVSLLEKKLQPLRLLAMPMVAASLAGCVVSLLDLTLWSPLMQGVTLLGQISIPFMLFALGVRLVELEPAHWKIGVWGGVICPLTGIASAVLVTKVISLPADQMQQLWLYSVLPPAVLNFMVAERYAQEPAQVAAIVLIGNLFSIAVIPVTLFFIL